ncbi:hypothetical protein CYY_008812 [Polysphondylium violaceum]|uniref:Ankyrin repeat-containing protein n=1 Tax=Polysphondylium violaceum TaxID=133409 RepID=A0A8J4V0Z3_9MYCE|nr:hypothetical protein CYY_008812 [Polysphondylium violaceum]
MEKTLYLQIFLNSFLWKKIQYEVVFGSNKKIIITSDLYNVGWMIKNDYKAKLKIKLHTGEYVLFDRDSVAEMCTITDTQFLDLCYRRFSQLKVFEQEKHNLINLCASKNNWEGVEYFVSKRFNCKDPLAVLEYACLYGNYQMAKDFYSRVASKQISQNCLTNSIKSKNVELVQMIFQHGKQEFLKLSIQTRERLLLSAASSGDLELFLIVKKYFESVPLFIIQKHFIYSKELVWKLLCEASVSYNLYRYCVDHFDYSVYKDNPPPLSPMPCISNGVVNVVAHLLENGLIGKSSIAACTTNAIANGHYVDSVYDTIVCHFSCPLSPIPFNSLYQIKNSFSSIASVEYLVETLGCKIDLDDLIMSTFSTEIFQYLLQRIDIDLIQYHHLKISLSMFENNNLELVQFYLENLDPKAFVKILQNNPQKMSFELVDYVFGLEKVIQHIQRIDLLDIDFIMETCASKIEDFKTFKLVFDKMFPWCPKYLKAISAKILSGACKNGRILNLKYLLQQGFQVSNFNSILIQAASEGCFEILKYLVENQIEKQGSIFRIDSMVLYNALNYNHTLCSKYLLKRCFNDLESILPATLKSLGEKGNLILIQHLYELPQFKKVDFTPTLFACVQNNHELLESYLRNKGVYV